MRLYPIPYWLRIWKTQGDDMQCPRCGQEQVKTLDGISSCYNCTWTAKNFLAAAAGKTVHCRSCKHKFINDGQLECELCKGQDLVLSEES